MTAAAPLTISQFAGGHWFLSNFFPAWVGDLGDGVTYQTAEHAYQAQKTLDLLERARITGLLTPGQAKRSGQRLPLRPDWEQVKKPLMLRIVLAKFRQNPDLAVLLCSTADARLVEGNIWHDQFWGDCQCGCPRCAEPGLNYLGQILEAVRLVLRAD
jgi:ribA/ribD-fused uncharacterized protein